MFARPAILQPLSLYNQFNEWFAFHAPDILWSDKPFTRFYFPSNIGILIECCQIIRQWCGQTGSGRKRWGELILMKIYWLNNTSHRMKTANSAKLIRSKNRLHENVEKEWEKNGACKFVWLYVYFVLCFYARQ